MTTERTKRELYQLVADQAEAALSHDDSLFREARRCASLQSQIELLTAAYNRFTAGMGQIADVICPLLSSAGAIKFGDAAKDDQSIRTVLQNASVVFSENNDMRDRLEECRSDLRTIAEAAGLEVNTQTTVGDIVGAIGKMREARATKLEMPVGYFVERSEDGDLYVSDACGNDSRIDGNDGLAIAAFLESETP